MNLNEVSPEMYPLYQLIFNVLIPFLITGLPIIIFYSVVYWKLYKKAGKPGWSSLIPIVNVITLLEIAELPWWYLILSFLPMVNIYVNFKLNINLAHKFGKSTLFGIALVFLPGIFFPILAFSKKAKYDNGYDETSDNNLYQPITDYNQPAQSLTNIQSINAAENVVPVQNTSNTPVQNIQTTIPNSPSVTNNNTTMNFNQSTVPFDNTMTPMSMSNTNNIGTEVQMQTTQVLNQEPMSYVTNNMNEQPIVQQVTPVIPTPMPSTVVEPVMQNELPVTPQPVNIVTPMFTQNTNVVENVVPIQNVNFTPVQPMHTEPTAQPSVVVEPTMTMQNENPVQNVMPGPVVSNTVVMPEQNNNNQQGTMM